MEPLYCLESGLSGMYVCSSAAASQIKLGAMLWMLSTLRVLLKSGVAMRGDHSLGSQFKKNVVAHSRVDTCFTAEAWI
jgi:hypothetical protein